MMLNPMKIKSQVVKYHKKILAPPLVALIVLLFYFSLFLGRVYPGIYISGVNVSGKTEDEVNTLLEQKISLPKSVSLTYKDQVYDIPLTNIDLEFDPVKTAQTAYNVNRGGGYFNNFVLSLFSFFKKNNVPLDISYDKEKLIENLTLVLSDIGESPVHPSIELKGDSVVVYKGSPGYEVDVDNIQKKIIDSLTYLNTSKIPVSVKIVDPTLNDEHANIYYKRGNKMLNKSLALSFEFQEFIYKNGDILNLIDPLSGYSDKNINDLIDNLAYKIDRNPQNPVFVFEEGKVKEFSPAKDGVAVDKDKLKTSIKDSLNTLESTDKKNVSISIPTINTPPEYQTSDVNNLGIKQLLGRGISYFAGSIASRIHNIVLASSKFNGVLIKPGDTFSFNDLVGEVSSSTGYQQAYIIQEGKTVLGDGGGVCQVSTTLFRAALDAGLPIAERRAHAYRVGYYEQHSQVGLDATVYAPTTDLKITNDTPASLLIQTSVDTNSKILIFEIYGTNDGRVATISKSTITNVTAPPEDLYIDDPTLPAGTVKQIDWKAWGAKVSFTYTVVRNGETLSDKTFYSNYQPWQAKFLRGTGV